MHTSGSRQHWVRRRSENGQVYPDQCFTQHEEGRQGICRCATDRNAQKNRKIRTASNYPVQLYKRRNGEQCSVGDTVANTAELGTVYSVRPTFLKELHITVLIDEQFRILRDNHS